MQGRVRLHCPIKGILDSVLSQRPWSISRTTNAFVRSAQYRFRQGLAHRSAYRLIWDTQYQDVIDDYCEAVMKLGDDWLSSPAGRRFQEACVKGRKASKALPTLDVACIRQYDGLKGIDFDGRQLLFVFGVLAEVAETSSYLMPVCPLILSGSRTG